MASLLGLLAALGYGLGDFVAGMLSRRVHFAVVAVIASAASLAVMTPVVLVATPGPPSADALAWGTVSGIGTAFGSVALFRGLGRGRMGVVAPLSALTAAVVPVVVGVVLGDRPALIAWAGVLLAVPAIWLVSSVEMEPAAADLAAPGRRSPVTSSVTDGLLAGAGFALLFIGLGLAGDGSGLWPVIANEASALVLLGLGLWLVLPAAERPRPSSRDIGIAGLVGLLGAASTVAYFLATNAGLLSIVVVLTALYPAVTVILAVLVTHEPIGRRQAVGLGLACAAIVAIVLA